MFDLFLYKIITSECFQLHGYTLEKQLKYKMLKCNTQQLNNLKMRTNLHSHNIASLWLRKTK